MKRFKLSSLAIWMVALLLQSCQLTKDYKVADLKQKDLNPQLFDLQDTTSNEVVSYASFFQNQELQDLIAQVLAHNNNLKATAELLLASDALLKSTKLNYLPDLNIQLNPSVQRLSESSMMGEFAENLVYQDYSLAANLSWEADLWGKLKAERIEASSLFLAETETVKALKLQLIAQTAEAYYNLLFLQHQLKEVHYIKVLLENSVKLMTEQYKYAETTSIALKQAKNQVFDSEKLILELKQSLLNQELMLSSLLGAYPDSYSFKTALTDYAFGIDPQAKIPFTQMKNRPDVRNAELQLQAANARVGINKAAFYPALNITAQGGLNSITATNLFLAPASLFGNIAGSLTQPLFNKRRIKSNYEQALHQREAKIALFKQELVQAVAETTQSLQDLGALDHQKTLVQNKMNNLDQSIEASQSLYQYGEITYIEVLSTQQLYLQAKIAYLDSIHKFIKANIQVFKAIGG